MNDEESLFIEPDPQLEINELKAKVAKLERHNQILQQVIQQQADRIEALNLDLHIKEYVPNYMN